MQDIYAEFYVYEAHVENMRSNNAIHIEWCGALELFFLLFHLHILFSFDMQDVL